MTPALARRLVGFALLLGLVGDQMLRAAEWRAGFALWVILAVLGVAHLVYRHRTTRSDAPVPSFFAPATWSAPSRERAFVVLSIVLSALSLVYRSAESLFAINFIIMLGGAMLLVWMGSGRSLRQFAFRDLFAAPATAATAVFTGAPAAVRAMADTTEARSGLATRLLVIGGGLALAFPPLLIVTALLASADPVFKEGAQFVLRFLEGEALGHLVLLTVLSWASAGWLQGAVGLRGERLVEYRGTAITLPFSALAATLYGVAVLLAIFVGLQTRALFGGAEYVLVTAGLTMAEYARGGFFELVVLSVFVLALLFLADRALSDDQPADLRRFRAVGAVLLGLTSVVMVSAVVRLSLYMTSFGLTSDRVFAFAILVGVAASMVWFALTVLRGARTRFLPGLIVLAVVWVQAQNLLNPDALVARTNLARARAGEELDVRHLGTLSADAVPEIMREGPTLPGAVCRELAKVVAERWKTEQYLADDWRAASLPLLRVRALQAGDPRLAERWGCASR